MGFDIVHVNLHKSFSQPHGGGGPGRGPDRGLRSDRALPAGAADRPRRGRRRRRAGVRPRPRRARSRSAGCAASRATSASSSAPTPTSEPRRRRAHRGVGDGGAERQLPARAAAARAAPGRYLPLAFDRTCMHEFVLSGAPAKRELGVKTLDVAKRLLDFGFHPPTIYFPLLVDEALMFEPTETETREALDALADAIDEILAEAERDPEIAAQRALHDPGAPPRRGGREPPPGRPPGRSDRSATLRARAELGSAASASAPAPARTGRRACCTRLSTSPASKLSASGSSRSSASLDLLPLHGRRDGRPLARPQRVDGDRRLVLVVLAPVDEHLALAQLLRHPRDDQVGLGALERLRDGVGERLRLLVGDLACSAARRPGAPSTRRSSGSTRARARRTARAAAARPGSSRGCRPARRGRGRRRARSGARSPSASESEGWSSSAASWAIQISVARSLQTQ